jgi:hypothetical protein
MTSLTSGRFQPPLVLPEGDTIDFVFRWSNNGTLFTPSVTPVWIFGIKDATTPSGDFLVQVNSASANAGVYTFTVPISSAELQAWLATATSQSYAAIQITDTANGIATTPLLCQITANQNDSGTTPTSANGTLNVAAGKTATISNSITLTGTDGTSYNLATMGVSDGDKGDITVTASGATWTIDAGVVTLAKMADMATNRIIGRTTAGTGVPELLTISGTGNVAMTTSPQFTTPSLGAATATSINGVALTTGAGGAAYSLAIEGPIDTSNGGGTIDTSSFGGSIDTANGGGRINTTSAGGYIDTSAGGGSLDTRGTGSIEFGVTGTRTTLQGSASGSDKTQTLPNASGTIALTSDITGGTLAGSFTTVNGSVINKDAETFHAGVLLFYLSTVAPLASAVLTVPGTIPAIVALDGVATRLQIPISATRWAGKTVKMGMVVTVNGTSAGNLACRFAFAYRNSALDGVATTAYDIGTSNNGNTDTGAVAKAAPTVSGAMLLIQDGAVAIPSNVTALSLFISLERSSGLDTNTNTAYINEVRINEQ